MTVNDRGFASMDENKQKDIASKGGKSSSSKNLNNLNRNDTGRRGSDMLTTEAKQKGGRNGRASKI